MTLRGQQTQALGIKEHNLFDEKNRRLRPNQSMFFVNTLFILTITARPIISYKTTVVVRRPWAVATTKEYGKNDICGLSAATFSTLAAKRLKEIGCGLFFATKGL